MDFIAELLQPYKEVIGKGAVGVTIIQILSGALVCNDIRRKKSTRTFSAIPFLGGVVLSILSLKLGAILRDDNIIQVNFIGLALNIVYVSFFYIYTEGKQKNFVWLQIGVSGVFSTGVLIYAAYEDPNAIEFRLGMILTVFLMALVASPFLSLGEVIRTKSTETLPFPIIASGGLVTFMWFLYGFCLNNVLIVLQNVVLLIITGLQLSLFLIYPSKSQIEKPQMSKKKKNRKIN